VKHEQFDKQGCVVPLLAHPLEAPTAFRPEDLVAAVRAERNSAAEPVPEVCVLEFDGDLTDRLVAEGAARPFAGWPCFHTAMHVVETASGRCGLVARTIGGPYAVLVAEQLVVCGARVILGLTSAGRVSPALPIPSVVVAERAVRDEGTSYHYLPADQAAVAPGPVVEALAREVTSVGLPVSRGTVWTTDAPYRETAEQLARHAAAGVLAVEMQAASLFAFAAARGVLVGLVAHVTNAIDHTGEPFGKGPADTDRRLLEAMVRTGVAVLHGEQLA